MKKIKNPISIVCPWILNVLHLLIHWIGYGFACGSGFLQTDGLTWVFCQTSASIGNYLNISLHPVYREDQISSAKPFYNPDTTSIKAPAGQGCPRCGGAVFAAEQQLAKGTMWHQQCFNCAECHRPLDSTLACDGPDREIHCRSCYAKLFGPKGKQTKTNQNFLYTNLMMKMLIIGFGYGHSPTLVSTNGESTIA